MWKLHQTDPTPNICSFGLGGGGTKLTVDEFGFPWLPHGDTKVQVGVTRICSPFIDLKSHELGGLRSQLFDKIS